MTDYDIAAAMPCAGCGEYFNPFKKKHEEPFIIRLLEICERSLLRDLLATDGVFAET